VHPGHADELLAALDPDVSFVVIECGDPSLGWHDALVAIGEEVTPRLRRVRNLAFDLLVNPSEAASLGPLVRTEHDGSLRCYQLNAEPRSGFRLPDVGHGRAEAMRGFGVHLMVDLPHDGEGAAITSTGAAALDAFVGRL